MYLSLEQALELHHTTLNMISLAKLLEIAVVKTPLIALSFQNNTNDLEQGPAGKRGGEKKKKKKKKREERKEFRAAKDVGN